MAIALTEKIREKIGGGKQFCVYEVTGLAAGANAITANSLGLNYIDIAEFRATKATTSAAATSVFPIMGTYSGSSVTITTVPTDGAGDSGSIRAFGY